MRRLADALIAHPDIIEQEMGPEYAGLTIIPGALHSMPYSRADDIDGVHFTDWSALTRFFDQPYFRIKVPHRVGNATLLHRTAIRKFWKGDTPTADDFLEQLRNPFQLELSMKHLDFTLVQFAVSEPDIAVTPELVRTKMTTRSVSEAVVLTPTRCSRRSPQSASMPKRCAPNWNGALGGCRNPDRSCPATCRP